MNINEFTKLIEEHGTDLGTWPESVRSDAPGFLASNEQARNLLDEQILQDRQLDSLMNDFAVPKFPDLETRVLNQSLPEHSRPITDRLLDWLVPKENFAMQIWRPAMAACLPLVFGIVVGNYFSLDLGTESDGFSYWEDELTMLSLSDYSENSFQ